jgi:hypothetical protein
MARSKTLDQLFLLFTAIAFIVGLLWLYSFLNRHEFSNKMSFFMGYNALMLFVLTWQGLVLFRRMPRFLLFHGSWVVAHIVIAVIWARSGYLVELCALALPLEAYLYFIISRDRLLRSLRDSAAARVEGSLV